MSSLQTFTREDQLRRETSGALAAVVLPTPLSAAERDALGAAGRTGSAASAWNNGTTWEERDVSKWAKAHVAAEFAPSLQLEGASVSAVVATAGTASLAYSRGKPRPGFSLVLEVSFAATAADGRPGGATGKVTMEEPCDETDEVGDLQLKVAADDGCADADVAAARAALRPLGELLVKRLAAMQLAMAAMA